MRDAISVPWARVGEIAETELPRFLQRQRWFPAKDAAQLRVRLLTLNPFHSALNAAAALWRIESTSAEAFNLFVPVALVPVDSIDSGAVIATLPASEANHEPLALVEAFAMDAFVRLWMSFIRNGAPAQSGIQSGKTACFDELEGPQDDDWLIRRGHAEQSNTSLRIGNQAILKVLRKLEEGPHPELEMSRYLGAVGFAATPTLLGWLETDPAAGREACTVSLLHRFVDNQGDGWHWVLERLGTVGTPAQERAYAEVRTWLRTVARRTAEMHAKLALDSSDADFQPEPVSKVDLQRWMEAGHSMSQRAIAGLMSARARLPPGMGQLVGDVIAAAPRIDRQLSQIADMRPSWFKTRHHGDFHLGQVLVAGTDALILDFEGEPMRALAERRAKHSVMRDVAGMVRSLAYVGSAAMRASPAVADQLTEWQSAACEVFARDYLRETAGLRSVPGDPGQAEQLLRFFMLEKALYELVYEMANRPDWIGIPLRAILDQLALA